MGLSEATRPGRRSPVRRCAWFSTGSDDFLVATSPSTVELLKKKHGYNLLYKGSTGGHTWIKWKNHRV
jgi:hypothetical protein